MVLVGIYYFNLFEERGRGQINYNTHVQTFIYGYIYNGWVTCSTTWVRVRWNERWSDKRKYDQDKNNHNNCDSSKKSSAILHFYCFFLRSNVSPIINKPNLLDHEFCPYIGIFPITNWGKVGLVALRMSQNTGPKWILEKSMVRVAHSSIM
jgi:hypothetical protein